MGIRGLETFLERIYSSEYRQRVYTDRVIGDLRFVVDGNNFGYTLSSLYAANETGGTYDQYYGFVKRALVPLAASIHLVVFDGCKESAIKARRRLESKIKQLKGTENNWRRRAGSDHDQTEDVNESFASKYPALFNRLVLYEVLEELGIQVSALFLI